MNCDYPDECSIRHDPSRPRITVEQVRTVLNCFLTGKPKKFEKIKTSGIKGSHLYEFVEVEADGYKLGCYVHGDTVTNVFILVTPSGKEWFINLDEGSPMQTLGTTAEVQLTELFLGDYLRKNYRIIPMWKIHRGEDFPYFSPSFHIFPSQHEAEKYLAKFQAMLAENEKKEDKKTNKHKKEKQ